ncbi:hypothetical protein [Marinobacter sp.]|uniref:hypothetical protein n=1 Tax=Marinobacter sp. TaxID=50741 RepID=UPI00356AE12F
MSFGADPIACNNLRALFDLCNERYFNQALRPGDNFTVRYGNTGHSLARLRIGPGTHTPCAMDLSARLKDHPLALRSILVREMIPMLGRQCYRETGDNRFLDQAPLYGHLFIEPGIGAFFLAQMEHLNLAFPELGLTVKPRFGSGSLFDQRRIPTARVLVVPVNALANTGIIYRLHDRAPTDWKRLRETAWLHHGAHEVQLLKVAGALAETWPVLRKDNQPRANQRPRLEDNFDLLVQELRDHRLTAELRATDIGTEPDTISGQFAHWRPEAYSSY